MTNETETYTMNARDWDWRQSGSSDPTVALTIPFRITKGKPVAYLAWKHASLAWQEVGKTDSAAGVLDPTTTEATKAPVVGAGEDQQSDDAEAERPNPPRLRREAARCKAGPALGRSDPTT
jgi:hypothetical protein